MEILDLRHFSLPLTFGAVEDEIATWGRMLSWELREFGGDDPALYGMPRLLPAMLTSSAGHFRILVLCVSKQGVVRVGDPFCAGQRGSHDRHTKSRNGCSDARHRNLAAGRPESSRGSAVAGALTAEKCRAFLATRIQPAPAGVRIRYSQAYAGLISAGRKNYGRGGYR